MAVEHAAASGEAPAAVEVLLDALEAEGALGSGARVGELRSELAAIARLRLGVWTKRPEVALVDLYARTLHLPELADARARWIQALDARGPWLQPLRPRSTAPLHPPDPSASQPAGSRFPPLFGPEGRRFVAGHTLYDGQSGAARAQLDASFDRNVEPPWPPWHVGTELIVCNHDHLQVWRARDGQPLPAGGWLQLPTWESIAYSRSGRHMVHGADTRATLRELPSLTTLATLDITVTVDALGLSPTAELVAVFGEGCVELHHRSGAPLYFERALTSEEVLSRSRDEFRLAFSADGRHLRLHVAAGEQRWDDPEEPPFFQPAVNAAWRIDGDAVTRVPGPPSQDLQLPPGWTLENGPTTVFRHRGGPTITVPCGGPWTSNPLDPRILGSANGLFMFRGL